MFTVQISSTVILVLHLCAYLCFTVTNSREIYMRNVSELLGTDGIDLRCFYTTDSSDQVIGVSFLAMNDSTDTFVDIAESTLLTNNPQLLPYGEYLFGSANITKVRDLPSEVVLSFNDLKCKHERNYRCSLVIYNKAPILSAPIAIVVEVSPSKPENVVIIRTPVDATTITKKTEVRTSISFKNKPTITFPGNDNIQTVQQMTESASIMEGDTITFKCSGNVGKPTGLFLFKKFRKDQIRPMNYTATTTEIEEIPGNCSYHRISYLTIQVTAEDNQAVIRCVVVSPLAGDDMYMYIDSEPLEVKSNQAKSTTSRTTCSYTIECRHENTAVIVVGTICGSIILVLCVILFCVIQIKKTILICPCHDRSVDYVNTTHQQNPSLYEGVGHGLDVHNYEQLSPGEHQDTNTNFSSS